MTSASEALRVQTWHIPEGRFRYIQYTEKAELCVKWCVRLDISTYYELSTASMWVFIPLLSQGFINTARYSLLAGIWDNPLL